ncbi:hypothetical protein QTP88_010211 [Uroleucon formosanum]
MMIKSLKCLLLFYFHCDDYDCTPKCGKRIPETALLRHRLMCCQEIMFNIKRSNLVEIIDNGLETNFRSNDIGLFANRLLTDADKKIVMSDSVHQPKENYHNNMKHDVQSFVN